MRRSTMTLVLALSLLGCEVLGLRGEQVPLITVETRGTGGCYLQYQVVDVIADPMSGTAIKGTGEPLRWPQGYTAWRFGSQVQVLDTEGRVVLTTGGRYWICPAEYSPDWVVGEVKPCPPEGILVGQRPFDCELGGGVG